MNTSLLQRRLWQAVDRLQSPLIRWGLVGGVLLLAVGIGYLAGKDRLDPVLILGAVLALLGIFVVYRVGRFEYGLMMLVPAACLLGPFTIPTGTQSRIPVSLMLSAGLLALWVLPYWTTRRGVPLKRSLVNAPIFAFAAVNVVSYIWSNVFRDAVVYVWGSFPVVQIAALMVNCLLPLLVILLSNKLTNERWLQALTWIMLALGAHAIAAIFLNLPTVQLLERGAGGLFATWVVALAFGQALFDEKAPLWRRLLLVALVGAWIFRNFVQSRLWLSGWIPLFIALGVIVFLRSRTLFLVVVLAAVVYVAVDFDYYYQEVFVANADEGGLERLDLWQKNLTHVANHPLLGMGPAGYAVYNMTYHPEDARSTHNNYFDILAQTGIIGSLIFIWLVGAFVIALLQVYRQAAGRRDFAEGYAAAAVGGWAAAVVAMMLGDWLLPFAYNGTIAAFDHASYTWAFVGGALALGHFLRAQAADQAVAVVSEPAPLRPAAGSWSPARRP